MAGASFQKAKALQTYSKHYSETATRGTAPDIATLASQVEQACTSANWLDLAPSTVTVRKSCSSRGAEQCQQSTEVVLQACGARQVDRTALETVTKIRLSHAGELQQSLQECNGLSVRTETNNLDDLSSDTSMDSEVWGERILPQTEWVPRPPPKYRSLQTFSYDPVQCEPIFFEEPSFDSEQYSGCNLF